MYKLSKDLNEIQRYLEKEDWLSRSEQVEALEKPGEGNMNFTLRVKTNKRSFIIKQSRDYVEKFPQVAAPQERVLNEADFYELVENHPALKRFTPDVLEVDGENNVMALSDLGEGTDYSFLYQKGRELDWDELKEIVDFAANLHQMVKVGNTPNLITNRKMRELNHEHIFVYPFLKDNGLNLDQVLPGLAGVADELKRDEKLRVKAGKLGEIYLADGPALLHGDYFPGSWLKTSAGLKIIDPEFCFFGRPEFEIGVMIAHLKLSDQNPDLIERAVKHYNDCNKLEGGLREAFTAIEVIRRIIGLAQLPLEISLEKRTKLLQEAHQQLLKF